MTEVRGVRYANYFRVVAIDFDGTLTESGRPSSTVLDAVARCRDRGVRVVLVTGRILDELRNVFPDVGDHFDGLVAENGAVLTSDRGCRDLAAPIPRALLEALQGRGVHARQGRVLVACSAADEHAVLDDVHRLGLEAQLVVNRSELMVLPSGVNKGTGLLAALADLGLSRHNTIAVGDAENDHSLFEVAELGVAVANAVVSLRERADLVLEQADGAGVTVLLDGDLVAGRLRVQPARWSVELGVDEEEQRVALPAAQINVLVTGDTGDGKSFIAGMVAEQLIGLGYSVLVVDPEGDHVGLDRLPGVLVVGGDRHLPPPAAVVPLLRHRYASVVADLSGLDEADQEQYLRELPAEVEAQRRNSGLPHWVIIDEAHGPIGHHGAAISVFDPTIKGHCLVTWRPEELAAEALASIDVVLALTGHRPSEALVDITAAVADLPRAHVAALLCGPPGRVVVGMRGRPRTAARVVPRARATPHFRHDHKYATVGASATARFYFRDAPDHLTGATAGNLADLEAILAACGRAVLRHHCPRHDLSRWTVDVFHDDVLGGTLRQAEDRVKEDSPAAVVEAARLDLLGALQSRRHR